MLGSLTCDQTRATWQYVYSRVPSIKSNQTRFPNIVNLRSRRAANPLLRKGIKRPRELPKDLNRNEDHPSSVQFSWHGMLATMIGSKKKIVAKQRHPNGSISGSSTSLAGKLTKLLSSRKERGEVSEVQEPALMTAAASFPQASASRQIEEQALAIMRKKKNKKVSEMETEIVILVPRLPRQTRTEVEIKSELNRSSSVLSEAGLDIIKIFSSHHVGLCIIIFFILPLPFLAASLVILFLYKVTVRLLERIKIQFQELEWPHGLSYLGLVYVFAISGGGSDIDRDHGIHRKKLH